MPKTKEIYTNWYKVYCCIKCDRQLTEYQVSYSDGVCPYCGNMANSTFVNCNIYAEQQLIRYTYRLFLPTKTEVIKVVRKRTGNITI